MTNNQKSGAAVAGASVTVYISGGDILGPTETDSDGNARFEVGMAGGEEDREATVDVSLPGFSAVTGHAVLIPKGTEEIPTVEIGLGGCKASTQASSCRQNFVLHVQYSPAHSLILTSSSILYSICIPVYIYCIQLYVYWL